MSGWRLADAEAHLRSLDSFGMRLGLDRMRRLLVVLGSPERRLRAIHVVGTNGKTSTVRMTAAILESHGLVTGAFLSPHLRSFSERIRVAGRELPAEAFAAAVERAAAAAREVERGLEPGDRVTQFELLTAAALDEFALRDVDVAVVEAGLGGRHDATNVLAAPVVVLTSVGLEHTRWLGSTRAAIADEKLAVVTPSATLVVGALDEEAMGRAEAVARRTGARLVPAGPAPSGVDVGLAGYQRANFGVAVAAAEAFAGRLDPSSVAAAGRAADVAGRLQVVDDAPLTILDGAHNPAGMTALVEALGELVGERRLVSVVSIFDDKDAGAMLGELVPRCAATVVTRSTSPRCVAPERLRALAGAARADVIAEADAGRALSHAREIAGPGGAVVVTGSLQLVGELLESSSRAREAVA